MSIITSLLDNDLYKFTMLQAFLYYEKKTSGEYIFICRTPNIDFSPIIDELNEQIDSLCLLNFSEDELGYLGSLPIIKEFFIDYLTKFKLNRSDISVSLDLNNNLKIEIKAPIIQATLFEVSILAIVNQLYFENKLKCNGVKTTESIKKEGIRRLRSKLKLFKDYGRNIEFMEFGTRRRFSFKLQELIIEEILNTPNLNFTGTSNVFFAKKFGISPLGTMAHEWIMAHSGVTNFKDSTTLAMERWSALYNNHKKIALTDTYTTDFFIKNIAPETIKKYQGVRHDSGDWKTWGYKILKFYDELGINPKEKTMVFSDSLDIEKTIAIHKEFSDKINLSFGIGTNLTNDVGYENIQPVIKMVRSNNRPVIKISDTPEKEISYDENFRHYIHNEINLTLKHNI